MPMWLIISILVYLMQDTSTPEKQKKAFANAAAAGLVTYGVSEYTQWGKENLSSVDGVPKSAEDLANSVKNLGPVGIAAGLGAAGLASGVSPALLIGGGLLAFAIVSGGSRRERNQ